MFTEFCVVYCAIILAEITINVFRRFCKRFDRAEDDSIR